MFDALKSLFHANSKASQDAHRQHIEQRSRGLPVGMTPDDFEGLRLGGMVALEMLSLRAFDGLRFDASWSGEDKAIEAVGVVELGQGEQLVRFYLENDTWVQASVANGAVFEYKVFDFYAAQHIADVEFDALINQPADDTDTHNALGGKAFALAPANDGDEAIQYARVWGADDSTWSPPVMLEERVTTSEGNVAYIRHHSMLYERHDADSDRYEYVLLNAEANDQDGSYQFVTNLGIDIRALIISAH